MMEWFLWIILIFNSLGSLLAIRSASKGVHTVRETPGAQAVAAVVGAFVAVAAAYGLLNWVQ